MVSGSTSSHGAGSDSLGPTDPSLSIYYTGVLAACRLHALLPLLHKPTLAQAVVKAVATATANAMEEGWCLCSSPRSSPSPINEYGALFMAGQVRQIMAMLEPYATRGLHRPPFAFVSQCVAVLGLDAPHDLYSLTFPRPCLTVAHVYALLCRRGWAANAARLNWDKVQAVVDPGTLPPGIQA